MTRKMFDGDDDDATDAQPSAALTADSTSSSIEATATSWRAIRPTTLVTSPLNTPILEQRPFPGVPLDNTPSLVESPMAYFALFGSGLGLTPSPAGPVGCSWLATPTTAAADGTVTSSYQVFSPVSAPSVQASSSYSSASSAVDVAPTLTLPGLGLAAAVGLRQSTTPSPSSSMTSSLSFASSSMSRVPPSSVPTEDSRPASSSPAPVSSPALLQEAPSPASTSDQAASTSAQAAALFQSIPLVDYLQQPSTSGYVPPQNRSLSLSQLDQAFVASSSGAGAVAYDVTAQSGDKRCFSAVEADAADLLLDDHGLNVAIETIKTGIITPLVKQGLKDRIQTKRLRQDGRELKAEYKEPKPEMVR